MSFRGLSRSGARVLRLAGAAPSIAVASLLRRGAFRLKWRWALVAAAVTLLLVSSIAARMPVLIADTATAWLLGGRTDAMGHPIPQICTSPPSASEAAIPVAPSADEASPPVSADAPASAPSPVPALDSQQRPTDAALEVIGTVPAGTPIVLAQAWVLFELAHPGGPGAHPAAADFGSFTAWYHQTSEILSPQATALEVVTSIDPAADYSPYLLLSQAATYRLMRQGSVTYTDSQRNELLNQIMTACRGAH